MEDDLFGYATIASSAFRVPLVSANSAASASLWNSTLGEMRWRGPEHPDDGSAGVREPRRPAPTSPADAMAIAL